MATYLEIVNQTLRRLRRQEVSAVSSSTYSTLIGDLANLAKREVEDAWNWLALMEETSLSVVSGTDTYSLTGYGNRYQIQQIHDTTNNGYVRAMKQKDFRRYLDFPGTTTSDIVSFWRIKGNDSNGDPEIQFWPEPTASSSLTVYAKVPQANLSADGDVLTVPEWPVILGAYAKALSERGEGGGATIQAAFGEYRQALADAISQDDRARANTMESDWKIA